MRTHDHALQWQSVGVGLSVRPLFCSLIIAFNTNSFQFRYNVVTIPCCNDIVIYFA